MQLVEVVRDPAGRHHLMARVAAARALGQLGPSAPLVVPELMRILDDVHRPYPLILDEALVEALGKRGGEARPAVAVLVRNMGRDRDLDRLITRTVSSILSAPIGREDIGTLLAESRHPEPSIRLRAIKGLAEMGPAAATAGPALLPALDDPDPDVRRMAFHALGQIDPSVLTSDVLLGVYLRDLQSPDESIRLRAVKAMSRLGPAAPRALPALQAAAQQDPDPDVRRLAAETLQRLGGGP
jgi:HEAT repeat protein